MTLSPDHLSASSHLLCTEDGADVASWNDSHSTTADNDVWAPACHVTAAALVDSRGLASLFAAEADHMPLADSLDAASRHDAVKWILKVNEFYRFRAVTAYLAVSYLDRFLSSHSLPASCDLGNKQGSGSGGGGWPMQLLSVACVSVAAKMEEVGVPALLDLQILGTGCVFDPRTVRRMELLLMAALGWRMRAVTPFDFLPYLAASASLLSRAADLVLSTLRVVDFLRFRPSAIAAAAALCAADEKAAAGDDLLHLSDEWVREEVVSECRQLMEDYIIDTCPLAPHSKPITPCAAHDPPLPPPPRSPVAVLDSAAACGSCNSASQASSSAAACGSCNSASQASSSAATDAHAPHPHHEPPPKRRRIRESRCTESVCSRLRGKPL